MREVKMTVYFLRNFFRRHPLAANSIVYGSLYVGAEFSQQMVMKKYSAKSDSEKTINFKTLAKYFFVGSVINSNYLYFWYKWLDNTYVGTKSTIIVKKVLLDQFVMTPPLYVIFFVSMSLMEGKKNIFQECKEKFMKTFLTSCVFWLPVQTINFLYLPNAARVAYMGFCSFAWVNILCWIKRNEA